jgi:cation/acetate symporter
MMTGNPIPQLGFGGQELASGEWLLDKLDGLHRELGFAAYTEGSKGMLDVFCITAALMAGTAGLPHVIIRFYTVPKVRDARASVGWALLFIAFLYTTAPAVAVFAKTNLIQEVEGHAYSAATGEAEPVPAWFKTWENTDLIAWRDKNNDGIVQYRVGAAFVGKPSFVEGVGESGERLLANDTTDNENELYVDRDIMVLANPEIARLPAWVIGLVAAGGLAAALSTAAGLLLVVSSAISHDLLKRALRPKISEKSELLAARISAAVAVTIAGVLGIYPPDYVAAVVAFAFGLAASSFFPAIVLGIFSRRMNRQGAVAGMVCGIIFTASYIIYFKFVDSGPGSQERWWWGISPEGIGSIGMALNFAVSLCVSRLTPPPPQSVQDMVDSIRIPSAS